MFRDDFFEMNCVIRLTSLDPAAKFLPVRHLLTGQPSFGGQTERWKADFTIIRL